MCVDAETVRPGRQVPTADLLVVPTRLEHRPVHRRRRPQGTGARAPQGHRADLLLSERSAGPSERPARRETAARLADASP